MKNKDIKPYLPYYIGQKAEATSLEGAVSKVTIDYQLLNDWDGWHERIKPILRKLSSMTEEEAKEFFDLHKTAIVTKVKANGPNGVTVEYKWIHDDPDIFTEDGYCYSEVGARTAGQFTVDKTHYLLSKGFWLFGDDWFEEGLIIEKK
jgi:hypothetical protein